MPTVFSLIVAYSTKENLPVLNKLHRSHLGHRAKEAYQRSGINKPLEYVKAEKKDCFNATVINYPDEFLEYLNSLVEDYYKNTPEERPKKVPREISNKQFPPETSQKIKPKLKPSPQPSIPKLKLRKRLPPKGEPVFSSKSLR